MSLDTRHLGYLKPDNTVAFQANRSTIEQARLIARTLGTRRAASYMCNRGWSIEAAMWALIGPRASLFVSTPNPRSLYMDIELFRHSDLYRAMRDSLRYRTEDDILDDLAAMIEEMDSGHDPEAVLTSRGLSTGHLQDILNQF